MASKTVLLIEDSEQDREIYSRLLYYNGYDLLFAETGEEGLEIARTERPSAVLLDLVLPGMDGLEVCRRLREEVGHELPIIVLTASDEDEARPRALRAGASAFVAKPAVPYDVVREIRRWAGDAPPQEAAPAAGPHAPGGEAGAESRLGEADAASPVDPPPRDQPA